MDPGRARELLERERRRTQERLDEMLRQGQADRTAANEPGDMFDSAQPLTQQGTDDSLTAELRRHLDAVSRAERRLEVGTYGFSVRSGQPIPDERLESDPTAELTVGEAVQMPEGE